VTDWEDRLSFGQSMIPRLSYSMCLFFVRIISGNLRGRALFVPKGQKIRPTSDQVKETLFNMLGGRVTHATVLDLFAGSGNVGLEALSRGAAQVVFVEKNPAHAQVITRNLRACRVESGSVVYCRDANKILRVLSKADRTFDIIFLDPPYRQTNMLSDMLLGIGLYTLLSDTGQLVVEHARAFAPPPIVRNSLTQTKQRRIGDTVLSFYQPVRE